MIDTNLDPSPQCSAVISIFRVARTLNESSHGKTSSSCLAKPPAQLVGDPIVELEKGWDHPHLAQNEATCDQLSDELN
eukprot:4943274-Prymnesium_polylepis.5